MVDEMVRAAREIHEADAGTDRLLQVARSAAAALPGIDHVSISRACADGRLETVTATDETASGFDDLQSKLGEGPCLYAAQADAVVRIHAERDEARWPSYLPEARRHGLRSQLGMRLHRDHSEHAALNCYSTSTDELDPYLEEHAEVFATWAAMALGRVESEEHLRTALASRRQIGIAIGVLMERYGLDDDQAFEFLRRTSQEENRKLRDLAADLVRLTREQRRQQG